MVLPAHARTTRSSLSASDRRFHQPFQLLGGGLKNSGHRSRRPNGRQYRAGESVRQSGIYEVVHDRGHREAHEVVMISGENFPDCDTCKDKVRFRLVRTAPYIFQDEDFEEEA